MAGAVVCSHKAAHNIHMIIALIFNLIRSHFLAITVMQMDGGLSKFYSKNQLSSVAAF